MRIAGNKLKHIIDFFYAELSSLYGKPETEAMMHTAIRHVLGYSPTEIVLRREENLNQSDLLKLYDCCKDLKKKIPLQYILGETWFYNLRIKVNKQVLIPRPETEELVELILKENKDTGSVLDIGTGSGCIPVALKKNLPEAQVFACDISREALSLAQKNAALNQVQVTYFETDILRATSPLYTQTFFDVIVSNPPYIQFTERDTMPDNVVAHEPHQALFVEGEDPVIFYKKIIDLCRTELKTGGRLYFELNPLTANLVKDYAMGSSQFENEELLKDMSGSVRFLRAVKI